MTKGTIVHADAFEEEWDERHRKTMDAKKAEEMIQRMREKEKQRSDVIFKDVVEENEESDDDNDADVDDDAEEMGSSKNNAKVGEKRSNESTVHVVPAKKWRPEREKDVFVLEVVEFPEFGLMTEGKNIGIKLHLRMPHDSCDYFAVCRLDVTEEEFANEFNKENPGVENNVAHGKYLPEMKIYEFSFVTAKFTRSSGGKVGRIRFGIFNGKSKNTSPIAECNKDIKVLANRVHYLYEQGYKIFSYAYANPQTMPVDLSNKRGPINKKTPVVKSNKNESAPIEPLVVEINNHLQRESPSRRKFVPSELEYLCEGKTVKLADFTSRPGLKSKFVWQKISRAFIMCEPSKLFDQGLVRFAGRDDIMASPTLLLVDGVFQIRFGVTGDGWEICVYIDVFAKDKFIPVAKWTSTCKESLASFVARCDVLKSVIKLDGETQTYSIVDKSEFFAMEPSTEPAIIAGDDYPITMDVGNDGRRK